MIIQYRNSWSFFLITWKIDQSMIDNFGNSLNFFYLNLTNHFCVKYLLEKSNHLLSSLITIDIISTFELYASTRMINQFVLLISIRLNIIFDAFKLKLLLNYIKSSTLSSKSNLVLLSLLSTKPSSNTNDVITSHAKRFWTITNQLNSQEFFISKQHKRYENVY